MLAAELRAIRAQIDATIASLEEQIEDLQADRQSIDEQLAAVVYPIHTLPREIISEIFLQYGCDKVFHPTSPLVLASVCSLWREVALHTHGLWNHFNSVVSGGLFGIMRNPERVVNRLGMHISRSGALPLNIRINMLDSREPSHEPIFRLLEECSARWGSLDIVATGRDVLPLDIQGPLPHLTRFFLEDAPIPPLLDAPNLVHVNLVEVDLSISTEWRLALPWSQLTTLKVFQMDVVQCLDMLDNTPNLENLHFACDDAQPAIHPPRVLPHLHTLSFAPSTSHEILPHLTLPKLRNLEVDTILIPRWRSYLQELITRSGCALQKFEFFVTNLEEVYEAAHLFPAIPTVQHLTINCPQLSTEGFTTLFDAFSEDAPVLPALESLELKRCETRIKLPPLVHLLNGRRQIEGEELLRVVDLKSFKLFFRQEPDDFLDDQENEPLDLNQQSTEMEGELGLLHELRDEGLEIDIRSDFIWFDECIDWKIIEEFTPE